MARVKGGKGKTDRTLGLEQGIKVGGLSVFMTNWERKGEVETYMRNKDSGKGRGWAWINGQKQRYRQRYRNGKQHSLVH